ncbi:MULTISPECIES: ATP synthase F1 subunit epsilon [Porphyromonadaceae]|uniref:ATP synthase subunit epsilon n=1 Tax=Sanguibacteroides justesenii TaxID=1547597 RepID=A0A0C3RD16_9PORP|nr:MULTISPECIES: ATP synthase F1 subunit epsilon [Porphyromonadaceae]KIO44041.1 ATP synthase subunit epsilon [Sanguibacteroides justesenii]KIO47299.1 ATP synthase subunit epsilon [Sanguibacteroides justesenii]MCR9012702.1 ATP synthase F1 subunit epsilon [Gabonibacter chumensis]PXZ44055.1 ATP synthase F1 subunit epsilon [Sanguibacteroides justesenii]
MMKLKIISPEKVVYKGEVERVSLPGSLGFFTVLKDHAPLVSSLVEGKIVYLEAEGEKEMEIESGVVEVRDNEVIICIG